MSSAMKRKNGKRKGRTSVVPKLPSIRNQEESVGVQSGKIKKTCQRKKKGKVEKQILLCFIKPDIFFLSAAYGARDGKREPYTRTYTLVQLLHIRR